MVAFLVALLAALRSTVRSRTTLIVEVFALRHQLAVLRRQAPTRLHLRRLDRRVLHFNVTEHPTAAWTAQQLREAWPGNDTARFLLHDRDRIYGETFRATVNGLGIAELATASRSPWQNPFVERLIGTLRRECLDHVVIWNERGLRRHLREYIAHYHRFRPHLSLDKDAPVHRPVQLPGTGPVVEIAHLGGVQHHDERRAA